MSHIAEGEAGLDCCGREGDHPACAALHLLPEDPFYSQKRCMNFTRSAAGTAGPTNTVTAYLDGSQLYGSSAARSAELREGRGGRLLEGEDGLLTPVAGGTCAASAPAHCFLSGDGRTNEAPGLALYHTVWHREHNRLADQLAAINPHWGDQQLFSTARTVSVALNHSVQSNLVKRKI